MSFITLADVGERIAERGWEDTAIEDLIGRAKTESKSLFVLSAILKRLERIEAHLDPEARKRRRAYKARHAEIAAEQTIRCERAARWMEWLRPYVLQRIKEIPRDRAGQDVRRAILKTCHGAERWGYTYILEGLVRMFKAPMAQWEVLMLDGVGPVRQARWKALFETRETAKAAAKHDD